MVSYSTKINNYFNAMTMYPPRLFSHRFHLDFHVGIQTQCFLSAVLGTLWHRSRAKSHRPFCWLRLSNRCMADKNVAISAMRPLCLCDTESEQIDVYIMRRDSTPATLSPVWHLVNPFLYVMPPHFVHPHCQKTSYRVMHICPVYRGVYFTWC